MGRSIGVHFGSSRPSMDGPYYDRKYDAMYRSHTTGVGAALARFLNTEK